MTLHPRLSRAGLELVKRFEGLRRKAARLEQGGWTIGYGHTASAREGAEVTAEQAETLLLYDLDKVARAVDALVFTPLNPNQFAALTAFAFNIGLENFRACAVLKRINEGAYLQAAAALELWRRADFMGDSLVVDALVRRRAAEKALFLTPTEGFRPVPTPVVRAAFDAQAVDLEAQASGLADAADLRVALDGEAATAERRDGAPGGATTEAVRNVAARLQELFPDADAPAVPPAQTGEDALGPEPTLEPEQEPERPLQLVVVPEPEAVEEAPLPAAEEPPPPPVAEPLPPPSSYEAPAYEDASAAHGFGRRPTALAAGYAQTLAEPAAPSSGRQAPVVLLAGLLGALMFVGALVAMIYGKATLTNLAIGLAGVVCMVPAGLRLLLKVFAERPFDDQA
ncbi:MAG TPA: lysozyme [Caulobacteraceae bacterium]|jgi:lysozyme|nr:lysozyme [Caulobacteraceae bacterium]